MSVVVHPVQNTIEDCLNRILSIRVKYAPTNNEIYLDQAEAVLSTLNARLGASDTKLINNNMWQPVEMNLRNLSNVFAQIETNGIGQLPNLAQPTDQLKSFIYQVPVVESPAETRSLRDAIEKARRSLTQQARVIKDEREKLSQQCINTKQNIQKTTDIMATANSMIDEIKTSHKELLEELNDAFAKEQNQRSEQFRKEQEAHQKLVDQEIQPFISQFEEEMETVKEQNENILSKLQGDINKAISQQSSIVENSVNEWVMQAKQIIDELNEYKRQAADLAGAIATTTHAGAYKKSADLEEKRASNWRIVAMAAFVLLVVAAGVELALDFFHPLHNFDWSMMSGRLIVTAAIASLAGYAAKQASGHAKNGQYNRRMELILRSIDPYLQSLEPNSRQKIKEDLAHPLFSFQEVATASESGENAMVEPESILRMISVLISKISDK